MRFVFVCLLMLYVLSNLTSQSITIKGNVYDTLSSHSIDFVSVYIEDNTGRIIQFTHSNEQGYYEIFLPKISDLHLLPSSIELAEVVVSESSLPLIDKNDTTTYRVASYIDSTEYSIEDVLKKLPGVRISEEGGIMVNGKPIGKVLIEGDDMFGANYTIGTRNIRANVIDKVQVIDHYQENPVLKDIQSSDKIVLNLSIKEEKKNIISGTYTLGTGYGEEWKKYVHTNLFSLSKKAKTFLLGNYNNNGFDAKGDLSTTFTDFNVASQSIEDSANEPYSLLDLPTIQDIGLPDKFTNRKQVGLGNLSQIFNLSSSFKVKISGIHYQEKNEQTYFNQNSFFSSFDTLDFREVSSYISKSKATDIVIQTDYLSSQQNKSLKTYSRIALQTNQANVALDRKENELLSFIPSFVKEKPIHIFNGLEYTQKLGKNSVSQYIVSHLYNENRQDLNTSYTLYPIFFERENLDSLIQYSNLSQSKTQMILRYLYNKKIALSLDVGYSWSTNNIRSNSILLNAAFETESQELSTNDNTIDQASPFFKAILRKNISIVNVSIGLYLARTKIKYAFNNTTNFWLSNPFLQLKIPINEATSFRFLYRYNTELPELNTLNQHFVFQDYQTISTGNLNFSPLKSHRIANRFSYKDVLNSFYFNANVYYSTSDDILGSTFNFNDFLFNQSFIRFIPFQNFGTSISIEKLFFDISSRFSVRYDYSVYTTQNYINDEKQEVKYRTNEISLDYGSAFDLPLNFYITNSLTFTNSELSNMGEENQLITWNAKLRLLYRPTRKFYVDANWYNIHNRITSSFSNGLSGIEVSANYIFEHRKRRNTVSINFVNLPNKSQFIKLQYLDSL